MKKILIAAMLVSVASCVADNPVATPEASAQPVTCPTGYVRHGNQCLHVPAPTPTPAPSPSPTPTPTPTPAPTPTPPPTPSPVPTGWVPAPISAGGYAQVLADEQSAPKLPDGMGLLPIVYSESIQRTVRAGETVKLAQEAFPAFGCACAGRRRNWGAYSLDGKFIGYIWESNLQGVARAQ